MNIVFVSHSAFDTNLVVGSHHLARQCAELGHQVVHISSPITPLHLLKGFDRRIRSRLLRTRSGPRLMERNLWEWVPFSAIPWQVAARSRLATKNLFVPSERSLKCGLKKMGMVAVDLLFMDEPRLIGIEKILKPKRFAYRATDIYSQMKNDPRITLAERLACDRADLRIGTSRPVARHLQALTGKPAIVVENGVDLKHFSSRTKEHPSLGGIARPRVVYVGAVDFRFDMALVERLAVAHPQVQFLIYGPISIPTVISPPPNLVFLGPLPYDELPSVLQHCDVGLLPMNDHPANNGRSPMKYYEYAAAGSPVLSRNTDEINLRIDVPVMTYSDFRSASAALVTLLNSSPSLPSLEQHSWSTKASFLINELSAGLLSNDAKSHDDRSLVNSSSNKNTLSAAT